MSTKMQLIDLMSGKAIKEINLKGKERDEIIKEIESAPKRSILLFTNDDKNERMVLMCPGGGLNHINVGHEGYDASIWFNQHNIDFAVLKYGLPPDEPNAPLNDPITALKLLQQLYPDYKKIGIMGASVGGYLAANAALPEHDTKVDFQILMYPVLSLKAPFTHLPTREKLFGKNISDDDILNQSLEYHVSAATPPTFIVLAADDPIVPATGSCIYCEHMLFKHRPISFHVYPEGGHSFGFNPFTYRDAWLAELKTWLSNL